MRDSDTYFDTADFDLEADFAAAVNFDDEVIPAGSSFMTPVEVASHATRQARQARQELERLSQTDHSAADEIAAIVNSNPDYDSARVNGYVVGDGSTLEADETHHRAVEDVDPVACFTNATASMFERFEGAHIYWVGDNAAWARGFNADKFAKSAERATRAIRYHGIEEECLTAKGQVRDPKRRRQTKTRRQARARRPRA